MKTNNLIFKTLKDITFKVLIVKGYKNYSTIIRNSMNPKAVNEKFLLNIIKQNQNTEYGRKYHFKDIHNIDDFKRLVPIQRYEDFRPYIERMYYDNENNLLTKDKVVGYARSSGSVGKPKLIPKINKDVVMYAEYTVMRFLYLAYRHYKKNEDRHMFPSRGLNLLTRYDFLSPHGLPATNVADIPAQKYFFIYPLVFVIPLDKQFASSEIDTKYAFSRFALEEEDLSFIFYIFSKGIAELIEYIRDNWQMLVNDIENGKIDSSIRVRDDIHRKLDAIMKPNPQRAAYIRKECEKGFDETILQRLWPNLSVISAIGNSPVFEGYTATIRKYSKGVYYDYSAYGASEALMGVAIDVDNSNQMLLPDSCYFEFVDPEDETAESTLGIEDLEVGKEYEIIITTRSGLYRYRFDDVIKVTRYCNKCPTIVFSYRKGQLINVTGEKTNFEQMTAAITQLEKLSDTKIKEWTVFVDRGEKQHRYGILLETEDDRDLGEYAEKFEEILREVNPQYQYYEGNDLIEPPVILRQQPGSHEAWKQARIAAGASDSQVKPVRILDTDDKREFFLSRIEK